MKENQKDREKLIEELIKVVWEKIWIPGLGKKFIEKRVIRTFAEDKEKFRELLEDVLVIIKKDSKILIPLGTLESDDNSYYLQENVSLAYYFLVYQDHFNAMKSHITQQGLLLNEDITYEPNISNILISFISCMQKNPEEVKEEIEKSVREMKL